MNAEFQKKQGEIRRPFKENNAKKQQNYRMGKTRDLFKKIKHIKGIFDSMLSTIKDRNGKGLTEAEEINKRQQEYTVQKKS